jgi:hypothetical protein
MARKITDEEINEWFKLLSEEERNDLIVGINIRAALLMHKLFPESKIIWELVVNKT